MNKKIEKVREDIRRTEKNIRDMQDHLKTLKLKEEQLVNEEIVRRIRAMNGRDGDVLEVLEKLYPQDPPMEKTEIESGEDENDAQAD